MKNQLGWWIAALVTIVAVSLGVALTRAQQISVKQDKTIAYLRVEQAKIGELSDESKQKLASEVARLEIELRSAQNAQRELTEQSFADEEEIEFLQYTLDTLEAEAPAEVTAEATQTPFPAYFALKRAISKGAPYHSEWEELKKQPITIDAEVKDVLETHTSGVASLTELKMQLRENYDEAHEVAQTNPILARLGDVITVRKLDKENDALKDIVLSGDVKKAAKTLRDDAKYQDWIEAYDARRDVLKALYALEQQLAGQHG